MSSYLGKEFRESGLEAFELHIPNYLVMAFKVMEIKDILPCVGGSYPHVFLSSFSMLSLQKIQALCKPNFPSLLTTFQCEYTVLCKSLV